MNIEYKPVIIVVTFNRIKSLQRILKSLSVASYPADTRLIISIDNNGSNEHIANFAEEFEWTAGEKEVIYHDEHLGLRNHILKCGDYAINYGSLIMLEDDLVVSPFFYNYAQEALTYYKGSDNIGGISLYNLPYTEALKQPFIPLKDDSDVYFKQIPSSLGQAWTGEQWKLFKDWYNTKPEIKSNFGLPPKARNWPDSSWKKYFYGYLVEKNKYFVFPQNSFTTNFNDPGENMIMKTYFGQVRLEISKSTFKFKSLKDSINVYDAYSELLPDRLIKLYPKLKDYDFELDLYNKKDSFSKEYVITSKPCKKYILGFDRAMKPIEMNIINDVSGGKLLLAKQKDILFVSPNMNDFENEYAYFYKNIFNTSILLKIIINRVKNRITSLF